MLRDKFITCSIQKINLISFEVKHIKLRQWQEKGVYKEVSNQVQGHSALGRQSKTQVFEEEFTKLLRCHDYIPTSTINRTTSVCTTSKGS